MNNKKTFRVFTLLSILAFVSTTELLAQEHYLGAVFRYGTDNLNDRLLDYVYTFQGSLPDDNTFMDGGISFSSFAFGLNYSKSYADYFYLDYLLLFSPLSYEYYEYYYRDGLELQNRYKRTGGYFFTFELKPTFSFGPERFKFNYSPVDLNLKLYHFPEFKPFEDDPYFDQEAFTALRLSTNSTINIYFMIAETVKLSISHSSFYVSPIIIPCLIVPGFGWPLFYDGTLAALNFDLSVQFQI